MYNDELLNLLNNDLINKNYTVNTSNYVAYKNARQKAEQFCEKHKAYLDYENENNKCSVHTMLMEFMQEEVEMNVDELGFAKEFEEIQICDFNGKLNIGFSTTIYEERK